ncbi:polymeric immunoglobulin receptor-like [Pogoniulus pusillus]|uniref:polymeric immunoglobulin receptor-like n=1 Tax=Pogoniulus pusillus TaxID=488313 RepID=UPI0030B91E13
MGLSILLLLSLCFPGLQGQSPDAEETRREGSSLLLECPYTAPRGQQQQLRGWGRVTGEQLEILAEIWSAPYPTSEEVTVKKVTLRDDSRTRRVTIIMKNLQAEDSGTYCCSLRTSPYEQYLAQKTLSLNVYKELHKWELDTVSVQCRYSHAEHRTAPRVWCRRGPSGCHTWLSTNSTWTNSRALGGRALMQDDIQSGTVAVTMRKLQARDAGTYWCALQGDRQLARLVEVRLYVSKRTELCTAKESGKVSVQCLYSSSEHSPGSKAWCRAEAGKPCTLLASTDTESPRSHKGSQGRVTIQDDSLQGIVTVTMSSLQAQDSGVYWCALQEQDQLLRMVEVTLSVAQASNRTTLSAAANSSQATPAAITLAPSLKIFLLLSLVLSILLILTLVVSAVLCVWWCKQLRRRGNSRGEDTCGKAEGMAQDGSSERKESLKGDSKDLKYATLDFEAQPSTEDALYCNIEASQAHRRPRDDEVQYAIIGLKELPACGRG